MEYTSIKMPKALAEKIKNHMLFIDNGYRSISEFTLDAVRRRMELDDSSR